MIDNPGQVERLKTLTAAEQSLQVELINGLRRDELDRRALHRLMASPPYELRPRHVEVKPSQLVPGILHFDADTVMKYRGTGDLTLRRRIPFDELLLVDDSTRCFLRTREHRTERRQVCHIESGQTGVSSSHAAIRKVTVASLIISSQLAEGATGEWIWNNPPTGVTHSFTAEPFCLFDYSGLHSTLASVEITDASRSLCASTKAVLYWQLRSRPNCRALCPFAPFAKIATASR